VKNFFLKPFRWPVIFSAATVLFTAFVLLDTFVIPRAGTPITTNAYTGFLTSSTAETSASTQAAAATSASAAQTQTVSESTAATAETSYVSTVTTTSAVSSAITDTSAAESSAAEPVTTATSYKDSNISISIKTIRENNTNIYVADIQVSSVQYLKTAFAKNTYGRNIKETTSAMAEDNNAIFAINGDYYGFRDDGYVLRNGILYRDTAGDDEGLAIDATGSFSIIDESSTGAQSLVDSGIWQVLTFGPALISNGQIAVSADSEVEQAMASNPRTAVGMITPLHYIFVVSDGRTDESTGLSLLQLAQVLKTEGCTVAYNLDGGGSATMWFNGQLVNKPTTNGNNISERSISDIVYIGY